MQQLSAVASGWMAENSTLAWIVVAVSIVVSLAGLILVPVAIMRIPVDYFAHRRPPQWGFIGRHPALRIVLIVAKNALGVLLILGGLVMLVVPGPGLVAMLIGLMLLDLPAKRRFERWLVKKPYVLKTLNALRAKRGRPPLEPPD